MHFLQDLAASVFIGAVALLSFVSILGVWDIFGGDVITKSFMTLGLLAVVAIVIIYAGRFVDKTPVDPAMSPAGRGAFKSIRQITLGVLIISASLLALLGVLAIWEVIQELETVFKTIGSLAILGFCSFIIVLVCLEREGGEFWHKRGGQLSGIGVLFFFLLVWLLMSIVF